MDGLTGQSSSDLRWMEERSCSGHMANTPGLVWCRGNQRWSSQRAERKPVDLVTFWLIEQDCSDMLEGEAGSSSVGLVRSEEDWGRRKSGYSHARPGGIIQQGEVEMQERT